MEVTAIVIAVLFAIVLSNVLNNLLPTLPLTLIQIAFGVILALLFVDNPLEIEPEIFMVLIIAPLLFREAEETNLMSLWRVKSATFLMAFVLVFITVFAIGFSLSGATHIIPSTPTIPIEACFVLGAILGPTDIVAVLALSRRIKIGKPMLDTLKGEGLINDASGLVAFNFAAVALVTGEFSAPKALLELLIVALGGVAVGIALAMVKRYVTEIMRRAGVESIATHLLIEILLPFLCYVAAEAVHTSGVLAVVAAGSVQAMTAKKLGLFEAEFGNSQKTVWSILTFTMNSLVFILLGLQIPNIWDNVWVHHLYPLPFLVLVTVLVWLVVFSVRFISVLLMARGIMGKGFKQKLKDALFLTLSGVKGAVSLAIAFSMPLVLAGGLPFAERNLLLFITAGTIFITLALALIFLPLLGEKKIPDDEHATELAVLREVVDQLIKQKDGTLSPSLAPDPDITDGLISGYRRRIRRLEHTTRDDERKLKFLRGVAFETERRIVRGYFDEGFIDETTYNDYMEFVSSIYHLASPRTALRSLGRTRLRLRRGEKRSASDTSARVAMRQHLRQLQELFRRNTQHVIAALEGHRPSCPSRLVDWQIEERREMSRQMMESVYNPAFQNRLHKDHEHEQIKGFYVERRVIHQFLERGQISKEEANDLRVQVNKLESYTLGEEPNEVLHKLISLTNRGSKKEEKGENI